MTPLDAIYAEIEQLIHIYGDPDLSYAPQSFRDECKGRVSGLQMALNVVDAARQGVKDADVPRWQVVAKTARSDIFLGTSLGQTAEEAIEKYKSLNYATWLHFSNNGERLEARRI